MSKSERDSIAAKARALAAKTVENGCTEAEAIAAAEALARLLAKHNMTMDEAEMKATPFTRSQQKASDLVGERLWKVAAAVADLTNTKFWMSNVGVTPIEFNFFGFEHEVVVAKYMLYICGRAMKSAHDRLEQATKFFTPARRRQHILPFLDGMCDRLAERIRAMIPPPVTGTGLVVLRKELIAKALKDIGVELSDRNVRGSRTFEPTYLQGRLEADKVALNRGLSGRQPSQRRLG